MRSAGRFTTGRPAALEEPEGARLAAAEVAAWQGDQDALLARSSFHALLDVLTTLVRSRAAAVLIDRDCYPVARWAVAAALDHEGEIPMGTFRHHDTDADRVARRLGRRPTIVVTDGWCSSCLRVAPLNDLAALAATNGGAVVIDDSLAAGVLGPSGRGSAATLGIAADHRVWVASAAKALAAPLGMISGPSSLISGIRRYGVTRVHTSPPTSCDVAALRAALTDPTISRRRRRVLRLAADLRNSLAAEGRPAIGAYGPLVSIPERGFSAPAVRRRLLDQGLITLVTRGRCRSGRFLTICLRADHRDDQVERLGIAVLTAIRAERDRS